MKRSRLFLAMLFLVARAACAADAQVTLRGEALVAGPMIRLGDIAAVQAADPALAERLAALAVGYSPRAGRVLRFEAADVKRVLARLEPSLRAVHLAGARRIAVRRGPLQMVEGAKIAEVARLALEELLAARYTRHIARPDVREAAGAEPAIAVPRGALEMRARTPTQGEAGERVAVWVDLLVDGREYRSVPVRFSVRAFAPALVAGRPLAAGTRLERSQFVVREVEVGAAAPVPPGQPLAGLRLTRALAAGAALLGEDLAQAPAVAKGAEVAVRVASGSIELETTALATRDARPGEVIALRRPNSRETFPARVVAAGVAEALWR